MKQVIIGIIFTIGMLGVFLSGCGENKIYTEKDVYQKEGQWYEKASNSLANGVRKEFTPDNKLVSEVSIKNGAKEGVEKIYFGSGSLKLENPYSNGKINGISKEYYESGKIKDETLFKDDKLNGESKTYYESGVMFRAVTYKDDKKVGVQKRYNETGKLHDETSYKNGVRNGVRKGYSNDILGFEITYKDGKVVNGIIYGRDGRKEPMSQDLYFKLCGLDLDL